MAFMSLCPQNDRGTDSDAEGSSFFRTYMKARIFCERRASLVRASLGEFNYRYNILSKYVASKCEAWQQRFKTPCHDITRKYNCAVVKCIR